MPKKVETGTVDQAKLVEIEEMNVDDVYEKLMKGEEYKKMRDDEKVDFRTLIDWLNNFNYNVDNIAKSRELLFP